MDIKINSYPTITLIIPHYNSPELLSRCLSTIPDNQSIQVIVVDDNSSTEIVDFSHFPGIERKYTEIIYNKESKSAGHARNLGLEKAYGDWLLFADADDFFTENAWEIINDYINIETDIIYFGITSVISSTLEPNDRWKVYGQYIENYINNPSQFNKENLLYRHDVPWGKLISHKLVKDNKIHFGETKYCNDTLFSTNIALKAKNVLIDGRVIYCVTSSDDSLTKQSNEEANLIRMSVLIKKNKLLTVNGKGKFQISIFHYLRNALQFGFSSFLKHLNILRKNNYLLFSNFYYCQLPKLKENFKSSLLNYRNNKKINNLK